MSELANITGPSAASQTWDAVVIGAGPSGALAAHQLAKANARVLLIERKSFPRYKVCGACVNNRALRTLDLAGLPDLIKELPARPLHRLRMYQDDLQSDLKLNGSVAISRSRFDLALVQHAIQAGASFLDETAATVELKGDSGEFRYVRLSDVNGDEPSEPIVEAKVVLAADGLTGSSLRDCNLETEVREDSRVGFGAAIFDSRQRFQPYTIHMAIHPHAYVGLVQIEDGQLNIAGAADVNFLRECGGPAECFDKVIRSAGLPTIAATATTGSTELATWTGTAALTRRSIQAVDHRLFLLGDASGYVEPFTGEGIAWALTSAFRVAPLAMEGIKNWNTDIETRWQTLRDEHTARHQRTCRAIANLLRRPALVRMSMHAVTSFPALATPFLSRMNQPVI